MSKVLFDKQLLIKDTVRKFLDNEIPLITESYEKSGKAVSKKIIQQVVHSIRKEKNRWRI